MSEPGVKGFDTLQGITSVSPNKTADKVLVDPGIFVCNRPGDSITDRPSWTTDGSFLVFRWLEQKVPEFKSDLMKFARNFNPKATISDGDSIGARIIGRWQSGMYVSVKSVQAVLSPTSRCPHYRVS